MAARKSSRVNRKYKTKYRVANWQEYERGLRSRGDITVWVPRTRSPLRGHHRRGWAERDPRDDSQSRATRIAAGVRVSPTGRRWKFFFSTSARSELAQRAPRPTVSKSRRRTGRRFAPHEPGRPSNTPAHRVPQNRQWPSSVRFQSLKTYQSRPMSFSPQ